ncbi:MAG: hypothetical protein ACD_42C00096G0005 [uncultured bacterium]|nr:MAG: hypothetical protein ACD_42C00096G0005 [uncultured bacterium]
MILRMIKIIVVMCCALGFSIIANATPVRTYDIEVLVFSHITPQTVQSEQWPTLPENSINTFYQSTASTESPNTAQQLQHEKRALQRNPGYRVLLDRSWQRSWSGDSSTITLPISGGDNLGGHAQLTGSISINLAHYFNVQTTLLLTTPIALLQKMDTRGYFAKVNQPYFSFQLIQSRRMRSNELNYFGHPLMGVLIKIIPIKN